MADLSLAVTVTRTELGLADLNLNDGVNYLVGREGIEPGEVRWRRNSAESMFVHGDVTISSVKRKSEGRLRLFAYGASQSVLQTNIDTVLDAFSQMEYTLTASIAGVPYGWVCDRADYQVGFTTEHLLSVMAPIVFSFPRSPIPAVGPL